MNTVVAPQTETKSPPAAAAPSANYLSLNPIDFENHFAQTPFLIEHSLRDHPLFQLDRIVELTRTLPEECIEYNAGKLPISLDSELTPRNGLSPEETVRRIEECESWMVLKYVEKDPEYRELLNACLDQLRPYTESIASGMTQAQAFVFVTSPGSVTPYHIDPEHNFLLQIRGSKEVRMLDGGDKSILNDEDLEHFYSDRGRNLQLKPEHNDSGWEFDLQSGQGLHFPVTFPHWVKNGDAVSVSFSITFRTPDLDRRRALYQINGSLRQKGFFPWAVGKNRLRDSLLYSGFRAQRRLKSLLGKGSSR